jgi:hypothetical protein
MFRESSIRSFRLGNFKKCNILIGYKSTDSFSLLPTDFALKTDSKSINKSTTRQFLNFTDFLDSARQFYHFYPTHPFNNSDLLLNSIINEYTDLTATGLYEESHLLRSNYFKTFQRIINDESFACPTLKLVENVARHAKVYLYVNSVSESSAKVSNSSNGPSLNVTNLNANMELLARWANFIKFDSPNEANVSNLTWPAYELPINNDLDQDEVVSGNSSHLRANDSMYFNLKNSGFGVNRMTSLHNCYLWNNLIPAQLDILGKFFEVLTLNKAKFLFLITDFFIAEMKKNQMKCDSKGKPHHRHRHHHKKN